MTTTTTTTTMMMMMMMMMRTMMMMILLLLLAGSILKVVFALSFNFRFCFVHGVNVSLDFTVFLLGFRTLGSKGPIEKLKRGHEGEKRVAIFRYS